MLNAVNLLAEERFLSSKISSLKSDEAENLVDFLSKVLSSNSSENEEATEQEDEMEKLGFKKTFLSNKSKIQKLGDLLINTRVFDPRSRHPTTPFADVAKEEAE